LVRRTGGGKKKNSLRTKPRGSVREKTGGRAKNGATRPVNTAMTGSKEVLRQAQNWKKPQPWGRCAPRSPNSRKKWRLTVHGNPKKTKQWRGLQRP